MKKQSAYQLVKRLAGSTFITLLTLSASAQTNVFDDIIAPSPNHTTLEAALIAAGLDDDLQNSSATLTVFAPDDNAFNELANQLGISVNDILNLPNLADILTYHVLGSTVNASAVTNGAIATPLFTGNTLKLTKTSSNGVYVNQAMVTTADLSASNGVVHSIDAVLLSRETVVDVAIDNGFTTLVAAVIQEELIPALSDPFAQYTVFAPNNAAFNNLAAALNTNIAGLLALPNLSDVLLYHVLGTEVASGAVTNGAIVSPLSTTNTLKLTKTAGNAVFVNQASVLTADVQADNGVVHVIDQVVLPVNTVVDVAIDNGFTTLTAAVVKAELVPALSDPFQEFTVFAPTDNAFSNLASSLGTDLNGLLNLPNLADILTYHVVSGTVTSADLENGPVPTLNGANIIVNLNNGVQINDATVVMADVDAYNGVVHVVDKVLMEQFLGISDYQSNTLEVYPNPTTGNIRTTGVENGEYTILNTIGQRIQSGKIQQGEISLDGLTEGSYLVEIKENNNLYLTRIIKK